MPEYSMRLDIPVPSKKNSYRVRFNQVFWRQIEPLVRRFNAIPAGRWGDALRTAQRRGFIPHKQRHPYWIDSTPEVKQTEQLIALAAKTAIRTTFAGPVRLQVTFRGKNDLDNALGVIFDGLQQSGVITNDRQIRRLVVDFDEARTTGFDLTLSPLDEASL